jgi:hypothetical protein
MRTRTDGRGKKGAPATAQTATRTATPADAHTLRSKRTSTPTHQQQPAPARDQQRDQHAAGEHKRAREKEAQRGTHEDRAGAPAATVGSSDGEANRSKQTHRKQQAAKTKTTGNGPDSAPEREHANTEKEGSDRQGTTHEAATAGCMAARAPMIGKAQEARRGAGCAPFMRLFVVLLSKIDFGHHH